MPDLESHRLAERLAYLGRSLSRDTVWGQKVREVFPRLEYNPKAKGRRKPRDEAPFARECRKALRKPSGSSYLSRSRKELYRDLLVGFASYPLVKRLGWSLEEIRSQWNWVSGSSFLNNEFLLTWQLVQNALPLNDWAFRAAWQTCLIVLAAAVG